MMAGPAGRISVEAKVFRRGMRVEVTGFWPARVVLVACFAVLFRKHRDQRIAMQVASATSPGPS
jgi:hypothetical protein